MLGALQLRVHNNFLYLICFFIAYVSLLNIFNVLMFSLTGNTFFVKVMPATKDVFFFTVVLVIISFIVMHRKKVTINIVQKLVLVYICVVFFSILISDASSSFILFNIRRISEFLVMILFFSLMELSYKQYVFLVNFSFLLGGFVCVFGFLTLLLPISFWDEFLDVPSYLNAGSYLKMSVASIYNTSSYTSDLIFLTGEKFPRMISTYVESTTLGSFFTFFFVYALFSRLVKYRRLYLLLFFTGGLLVFSKAFIFSVFIVGIYYLLKKPSVSVAIAIVIILFLISAGISIYIGKIHGGLAHFIGFYTGFDLLINNPLGFGLGEAGNRGQFSTGTVNGGNGGESGIGNILAQIGVFGLLVPIIFLKLLSFFNKVYYQTYSAEYVAIFVVTVVWFIILCLSASSLGLTGNYIFFIFIGILLNSKMKANLAGGKHT